MRPDRATTHFLLFMLGACGRVVVADATPPGAVTPPTPTAPATVMTPSDPLSPGMPGTVDVGSESSSMSAMSASSDDGAAGTTAASGTTGATGGDTGGSAGTGSPPNGHNPPNLTGGTGGSGDSGGSAGASGTDGGNATGGSAGNDTGGNHGGTTGTAGTGSAGTSAGDPGIETLHTGIYPMDIVLDQDRMYYVETDPNPPGARIIRAIDKRVGGDPTSISPTPSGLVELVTMNNGLLYWIDYHSLNRIDPNVGTVDTLVSDMTVYMRGYAIGPGGIYLSTSPVSGAATGDIDFQPNDMSRIKAVVPNDTAQPGLLLVDPSAMFVANSDDTIDRIDLTTFTRTTLVPPPMGVYDWTQDDRYLYVCTGAIGYSIARVDKTSGAVTQLVTGTESMSIAADGTDLYWSTYAPSDPSGVVMRVPKVGGTAETIASGLLRPGHVAVDDEAVYWTRETMDGAIYRRSK
jgi:hypothetical protein